MLVVAAIGGNALLPRGEPLTAAIQRRNARRAAHALAALADGNDLVVTHGNGPQVGMLAEVEDPAAWPLDVVGAQTDGMIGAVLEQELRDVLGGREVATLLTQTVVDADDPAFALPTKPVGPVHPADRAGELRARGWEVAADGGGVRRVVASPEPQEVLGLAAVRALLGEGTVVICGGGGGVPVVRREGRLCGVEAVIDKDLTAAALGVALGADALLLLTDVAGVLRDPGAARPEVLRTISVGRLAALHLPSGSMGTKAAAAARFSANGGRAAIGSLDEALAVLTGAAGTEVLTPSRFARTPSRQR